MEKRAIGPDILRGLAILLVAGSHMYNPNLPDVFSTYSQLYGWMGVDIFFVLSGYLIGTELLKPVEKGHAPDLRVFYLKRCLRILPVFWLVLLIYVAFPILREGETMAPPSRFLTFTLNFGLDIRTMRTFSHAWSLCVEEHFYLLLPVVILGLHRVRKPWLPVVVVVALIIGGMVLRHSLWLAWQAKGGKTVDFMQMLYYPSYTRFDGLILGVGMAALRLFHRAGWDRFARPGLTLSIGALCVGLALYMEKRDGFLLTELGSVVLYPLFACGVAFTLAALLELEGKIQWARWSGLGFIAAISYSFYLSQKIVFHADNTWLPQAWLHGWTMVAIFYATAIAVGALLYFAVERPMFAVRRILLDRLRNATVLKVAFRK
jgi:peptidoglycan/LPS O-acetylase OafA/YrhL